MMTEVSSRYRPARTIASAFSLPYCLIINFRNWLYDQKILPAVKLPCPVISVGNITVGGTGKTPCVIMLAKMLQKKWFSAGSSKPRLRRQKRQIG